MDLLSIKETKDKNFYKVKLECWIEFNDSLKNQYEYSKFISGLSKKLKNILFGHLKNDHYFVDLDIRDSPSKTAYCSTTISIEQKFTQPLLKDIKAVFEENPNMTLFFNTKKRKT